MPGRLDENGRPEIDRLDDPTVLDDEELMLPEESFDEGEHEKEQMTLTGKASLLLGSLGVAASVWKIFPSAEGSPVKPYDGVIFFGGIACVALAGGIVAFSEWKNNRNHVSTTYEDESL